jgi:hypothetical protein
MVVLLHQGILDQHIDVNDSDPDPGSGGQDFGLEIKGTW